MNWTSCYYCLILETLVQIIVRGFHYIIQRYFGVWNREVPLYTEMSSFQGFGIDEFHCIQRCPHFRGLE